ncbi:membrane protein insertase YidC [bacterium]|nr:membrane protein insertase YidC [bacterium]MBU1883881.1 membrane protein insertase YidC [bacterium]
MFDKLTSNQRLLVAVGLSFVFFIGYTTIFPPKPVQLDANATKQASSVKEGVVEDKKIVIADESSKLDNSLKTSSKGDLVTIKSDDFVLKIDTLGRISSDVLLEKKYDKSEGQHAELVDSESVKPLLVRFADDALNQEAMKTPYSCECSDVTLADKPATIVLTQKLSELTVTKSFTFYKDGHYDAKVSLSKDARYYMDLGQRPRIEAKMMTVAGAMVYYSDNKTKIFEDGDVEGRSTFTDVHLISAFDQYFANIIYGFDKNLNILVDRDVKGDPRVYIDASKEMEFHGYVGPKTYTTLKTIDPVLVNAIEYGWFTFASRPLFAVLAWLHSIFGNWGWAIIGLTALVRFVLYPLTYKGMVSMQKMKQIAPKIKEVQAKYKGDPQRMNAAVMEMYKKHGANPLGGCLPMVLQIPVFFAMYRVFLNAPELQGAPWILWVQDLSRMDHLFILPILMGATMYYQQKITPSNFTDPLQEKVFKFLPVIFTFFFVTFPSGLVLYWFVNNLFSIAQQFIVNKQFQTAEAIAAETKAENKND